MRHNLEVSTELANKIVKMLHEVTGRNVNFMNQEGTIIATMQAERLGTVHEGAKRIMSGEVDELAVSAESAKKLSGVQPGYNGVVIYNGKRLGCIGLSGEPEMMRPLQKMAAIIVKEEYSKALQEQAKQEVLEKICAEVEGVSNAIKQITQGSMETSESFKLIEEKANASENYLKNIDKILDVLKNMGNQTRLLGLNAAIEAARVGEHGRGFAVVAQEMERLSTGSINSLKDTNDILTEIQASVVNIAESIRNNTLIIYQQAESLQHISDSVMEIRLETEKLITICKI